MYHSYSVNDFLSDPALAIPEIASSLQKGQMMLFLGAGVSQGFGLPSWHGLVASILGKAGDKNFLKSLSKESDQNISKMLDDIDDAEHHHEYLHKVYNALYSSVNDDISKQLPRSITLLAVAALITGRCRGSIDTIVTYNFDDLLFQYLQILGLRANVRTSIDDLTQFGDVEINCVHGYLPKSWKKEPHDVELILSAKSFRKRRAEIDARWGEFIFSSARKRICLFLGLSGDDSSILDVLERLKLAASGNHPRRGYWLLTPDAYERNWKSIKDVDIIPLKIERDSIADFVLKICSQAADWE